MSVERCRTRRMSASRSRQTVVARTNLTDAFDWFAVKKNQQTQTCFPGRFKAKCSPNVCHPDHFMSVAGSAMPNIQFYKKLICRWQMSKFVYDGIAPDCYPWDSILSNIKIWGVNFIFSKKNFGGCQNLRKVCFVYALTTMAVYCIVSRIQRCTGWKSLYFMPAFIVKFQWQSYRVKLEWHDETVRLRKSLICLTISTRYRH